EVDDQAVLVSQGHPVFPGEVLRQAAVVIEPPEEGCRQYEVRGPLGPERLELGDRLVAVGRVVSAVDAVLVAGEVAGPVPACGQQLLVSLADHERLAVSPGDAAN